MKTKHKTTIADSVGVYAYLLNDATLKTVLDGVENEQLLIEIIEFLIPGKHISSISKPNKEKHGLTISEKVTIFDLLCQDADTGEEFLVEVQNAPDKTFKDRALYYSLVPVREQLEKKLTKAYAKEEKEEKEDMVNKRDKMDYSIRPVYVISLVNFDLSHDSPDALENGYVSRYELRNGRNGELMTGALNFVFVEMDRLPYGKDEYTKCRTRLERFIFGFKFMHTFTAFPKELEDDPLLEKLACAAELANMSVLQREQYDKIMEDALARLSEMNTAREMGREEGREEGRDERNQEIANIMLGKGFDGKTIAECLGISEEEVRLLSQAFTSQKH